MRYPLFSVAMVAYNQRKTMYECIDSVLLQDYPNIELIVCDDGSYDFDEAEMREYIQGQIEEKNIENIKNIIVHKNEKNVGIVKNNNIAIKLASGEYIKLIAGDDKFISDEILSSVCLHFRPNVNVICTRVRQLLANGEPGTELYPADQYWSILCGGDPETVFLMETTLPWSTIPAPGVFFRRAFLDKIGGFDGSYVYTEDWPLWIKLSAEGERFLFLDMFSVWYRMGGVSNISHGGDFIDLNKNIHFQEIASILRDYAYPIVKEKYGFLKRLRGQYAYKSEELNLIATRWDILPFRQKFSYKMRYFTFSLYVKLLYYVRYARRFAIKDNMVLLLLLGALILMSPQTPEISRFRDVISIAFIVDAIVLGIKLILNLPIWLASAGIGVKIFLRGGGAQ